ncbi:hypothetical protein GCM10027341_09500 [Spirosoma knui]
MQKLLFLLVLLSLTGCQKNTDLPDPASFTLVVANQPHWKVEPLNGYYAIQFPPGYEGNGMVGFEGPIFSKNRIDKQAQFAYAFCGSLSCSSYGPALPTPYPSVPYPSTVTVGSLVLDQSVAIFRDNQLQAVFYFSKKPQTQGVLYLKEAGTGVLRQSLSVSYDSALHSEVLGILQTIRPE